MWAAVSDGKVAWTLNLPQPLKEGAGGSGCGWSVMVSRPTPQLGYMPEVGNQAGRQGGRGRRTEGEGTKACWLAGWSWVGLGMCSCWRCPRRGTPYGSTP